MDYNKKLSVGVNEAWKPLPTDQWNEENARHLLNRAGWSASPDRVKKAVSDGLKKTLEDLFPLEIGSQGITRPPSVIRFEYEETNLQSQIRNAKDPEERNKIRREIQNKERNGINDLAMQWITDASQSKNSAFYKWVLFLSDVYVVGADKVRNPTTICQHFDIISKNAYVKAPSLTKNISRSPAMIQYLDLNNSDKRAPNENFARELFELFVLGEGNYSEKDIKEAAKSFTGYKARKHEFYVNNQQHDFGIKHVFGTDGQFHGDDVIDLAYRQPAAGRFIPQEMVKFYLSDEMIPIEYLDSIGKTWSEKEYSLRYLIGLFFGSNLFYAKEFKNNYIKSPIHLYCGLVQDIGVRVSPLQRMVTQPLRSMGQTPFYPPNVRGWVGGKNWINSSTIQARRQIVESLFATIDDKTLNADEKKQLESAGGNKDSIFTFNEKSLSSLVSLSESEAAKIITKKFLANPSPELVATVEKYLGTPLLAKTKKDRGVPLLKLKRAIVTVLQSPEYQLC